MSMAQGITTYDRTNWTVTASSQELSGDGPINGRVAALTDGDSLTFWSSRWTGANPPALPHTLVVDMKVAQPVNQLYYIPRNSYNSVPTAGSVSFGDDGTTFGAEIPVTFSTKFTKGFITLPAVQNHRYFRITLSMNQHTRDNPAANDPATTMSEVGAMSNPAFPVILSGFKAEPQGTTVKVSWATSLEKNVASYTVTRSADALNFTPISSSVVATGSPTTASTYSLTDAAPLTGIGFYRLEQKNTSGDTQKSTIITTEYPAVVYSSNQPKNLTVFYFIPSDVTAVPDFKNRLDTILVSLQTYYGNEMQRNGRGYKPFNLVTDATQTKVKISVVNGKKPFTSYPYQGGGAVVQAEIDAYIAANPSPFYGSHNLVLLPAFAYDPVKAVVDERVPFYGSGKNCYALDYADLRHSLLGVKTPRGNLATVYIGGMAHEMGHGFNLPHNHTKVSEVALGTLLMGAGNYTYGKSTTSLSAADAAILNRCQVFNDSSLRYYGPVTATIKSLHGFYSAAKKAIILTGRVASAGSPVTDVTVYNDPAPYGGNKDYDAVSWQTPIIATDSFYVEEPIADLQVNDSARYQLKIKLVQKDGNVPDFFYTYNFVNHLPDIAIGTPVYVTVRTGFWNDASVWLCGAVPTAGSVTTIRHAVTIPANYTASGGFLHYDTNGSIIFGKGSQLRLGH